MGRLPAGGLTHINKFYYTELMKIQQFKMQLVNKILEIDDPELLNTLRKVIDLHEQARESALPFPEVPDHRPKDEDLEDLKKDINEIFGQ